MKLYAMLPLNLRDRRIHRFILGQLEIQLFINCVEKCKYGDKNKKTKSKFSTNTQTKRHSLQ